MLGVNKEREHSFYRKGSNSGRALRSERWCSMSPTRILRLYYLTALIIGLVLTIPVSQLVKLTELGARGAFGLILCWNVLFLMILPLVLDWLERRYLRARFLAINEIAKDNPQLAEVIAKQCERLHIGGLKFAVVDTPSEELLSYGLWRSNPRLIVPDALLKPENQDKAIPSVEAELARFTRRDDSTVIFLMFAAIQAMLLVFLVWLPQ